MDTVTKKMAKELPPRAVAVKIGVSRRLSDFAELAILHLQK